MTFTSLWCSASSIQINQTKYLGNLTLCILVKNLSLLGKIKSVALQANSVWQDFFTCASLVLANMFSSNSESKWYDGIISRHCALNWKNWAHRCRRLGNGHLLGTLWAPFGYLHPPCGHRTYTHQPLMQPQCGPESQRAPAHILAGNKEPVFLWFTSRISYPGIQDSLSLILRWDV